MGHCEEPHIRVDIFFEATLELSFDKECVSIVIPLISLSILHNIDIVQRNDDQHEKFTIRVHEHQIFVIEKLPSLMVATILDPRFECKYLNSNEADIAVTEQCPLSFLTESEVSMQSSRSTDNADVSSASAKCESQAHTLSERKDSVLPVGAIITTQC
ncbi:hypothetical protein WA026_022969 [Henosepilachna vigintioctopunctata]|uniref:Uncharacterized protein n=1 Tax=Henosepilachna vigintioctopunctata TaxID=420089 RepID=A0AAW1U0R0_9CUCU